MRVSGNGRALAGGALCALLAIPATATAAGFTVPAVGTRALGRGGASVASVDDLTALWWNPANLMRSKGHLTWTLDVSPVFLDVTFDRLDEGDEQCAIAADINQRAEGCPAVENDAPPFVIPFIGLGSDFGLEDFSFAAAVYGPYTGKFDFPRGGPQRYNMVRSSVLEIHYQLAGAWEPVEWLRIGGSVQNVDVRTSNRLMINAGEVGGLLAPNEPPPQGLEDPRYDLLVTFDVADKLNFSWNAGIWVQPFDWLELAASFQPGVDVEADGKLGIVLPPAIPNLKIEPRDITLHLELPWIARAGARIVGDRWDLELAYVYEAWSSLDKYRVDATKVKVADLLEVGEQIVVRDWKDSFTISLGGAYELLHETLTLRAGYFFDERAVPPSTLEVSVIDASKHGVGVGFTWKMWSGIDLDFGYEHIFMPDRFIRDSRTRQIAAVQLPGIETSVVANGAYQASYDIVSLGVRGALDFE